MAHNADTNWTRAKHMKMIQRKNWKRFTLKRFENRIMHSTKASSCSTNYWDFLFKVIHICICLRTYKLNFRFNLHPARFAFLFFSDTKGRCAIKWFREENILNSAFYSCRWVLEATDRLGSIWSRLIVTWISQIFVNKLLMRIQLILRISVERVLYWLKDKIINHLENMDLPTYKKRSVKRTAFFLTPILF